jgi:acyl-CoA synthetase (AMP-forming)/AMP-acid ligase II
MIELLRDRAAAQSGDAAFTFLEAGEREQASLTWGQIEARSRAIGAVVAAHVEPGARVLILLPPSAEFVPAFFGVLYAGAIAIPAYPPTGARGDRSSTRLRGMISDAGVTLVLSSTAVHARAAMLEALVPELAGMQWINVEDVEDEAAEAWRVPRSGPDSITLLQYTSGSTAVPRGVVVTHANLLDNLAHGAALAKYDSTSVGVSWLPVNHDMGLINGVLQPVFSGYPSYLMSPAAFLQRPARWLQAISRYGATHSGAPNFAYDLCTRRVSDEERSTLDLRTWRIAYNGSEPVRRSTLENFHRAFAPCGFRWDALRPAYGLAESTLLVTSGPADGPVFINTPDGRSLVSSGVIDGVPRIRIVDPQARVVVPDGVVGEIWVSSPSVASGYWHKPEETARTFGAVTSNSGEGPYLRTGDVGCIVDGRLFVTGRSKDVLIVRGVKYYPQDLETTAEHAHPAVRPGCCAAFAIERDGEECVALVAETDASRAEIDGELHQAVTSIRRYVAECHQVAPCAVAIVPAGTLPKTTSGKLQRFLCRDGFLAGEFPLLASWSAPVVQPFRAADAAAVGQPFRAADAAPVLDTPAVVQPFRAEAATS